MLKFSLSLSMTIMFKTNLPRTLGMRWSRHSMFGAEDKVALEDVEAEEIIEVKSNRNQKMHLILPTTQTAEFLLRM